MGSGASSREHSTAHMGAGGKDDSGKISGSVDTVEGGMQWLLTMVDKEKREKAWLAGKYDEKCAEVKALQEELAAMRTEVNSQRAAASERQRAPPIRGTAPDVLGKAAGNTASFPISGSSSSTNSTGLPVGNKLKDRRGLKLVIEAPCRGGMRLGPTEAPVSPVTENKEEEEDTGPAATRTRSVPSHNDDFPVEPMSALLRRREDWSVKRDKSESPKQIGNLHVSADKVFSMFEDGPSSPKRRIPRDKGF